MHRKGNPLEPWSSRDFSSSGIAGFFMALITGQQITNYFKQFGDVEVAFNKDVIRATGLMPRNNLLKCKGEYWPCFVYSSSMKGAKVVASVKEDFHTKIKAANNLVSLQFSFKVPDKTAPLVFFVSARVSGFSKYGDDSNDLSLINLAYTQQPPDDLIAKLGRLLETNLNSQKRKEERIQITDNIIRKIGLKSKSVIVLIDNIPRKSIIRDISFSGTKLIIAGIAKFLVDKVALVRIETEENNMVLKIPGKVVRFEPIADRKDIASIAIQFEEKLIPIEYKILINDYLSGVKPGAAPPTSG